MRKLAPWTKGIFSILKKLISVRARGNFRSERGRYLTPTDADIEGKFRLIATGTLGQAKTDKVVALGKRFETLPDMKELIDALRQMWQTAMELDGMLLSGSLKGVGRTE